MKFHWLCLFLMASACNQSPNPDYPLLIGTWTSEIQADSSILDVEDKMTFTANDSVIIETSINGEQVLTTAGKYSIDKVDGTITFKTDSFETTSKIVDLNSQSLVLQIQNPKGIWRLKRVH